MTLRRRLSRLEGRWGGEAGPVTFAAWAAEYATVEVVNLRTGERLSAAEWEARSAEVTPFTITIERASDPSAETTADA